MVVELCLIMPARLSDLLSVLPKLMLPLLKALQSNAHSLVNLGLRTLEYWVDSLNPEFLEPAMAQVVEPLMTTIWSHLKPHPYPFGSKVRFWVCRQILGPALGVWVFFWPRRDSLLR